MNVGPGATPSRIVGLPATAMFTMMVQCDLFSVDGDHSYEGSMTDFLNAINMAPAGGIILADDVSPSFPGIEKAWQTIVDAGLVLRPQCEANDVAVGGFVKRWCWGYVSKASHNIQPPRLSQNINFEFNHF
jgi:hypothetical protein